MLVGFKAKDHPQQQKTSELRPGDRRATPPEVFDPLNAEFGFTVDVAAERDNAKVCRYFSPDMDGLSQNWDGEVVWCNPPFSRIRPWVEKAWASHAHCVVMLLPANRTEQGWWQDLVEPFRGRGRLTVRFLRGRIRFIAHGDDGVRPNNRPPFGCCLLIWGPNAA